MMCWSLGEYIFKFSGLGGAKPCLPAHVAQWSKHLGAMCSRARHAQWSGPKPSAQVCPPTKELFQIIPMHTMNRAIILNRKNH